MDNELLAALLAEVDKPIARYSLLESYYSGSQQNGLLTREQRELLGNKLTRLSVNIPRLTVSSIASRLHVTGFQGAEVFDSWIANDCDQMQDVIHREALTLGTSYAIVWAKKNGKALVTVESAWQMACLRDPGTREITSAIKKWETDKTTELVVFLPTEIIKLRAQHKGSITPASFQVYERIDNPLNCVPVVEYRNTDRFNAVSELDDVIDLVDGLNLALINLAVAQEFYAHPTEWATGVPATEKPVVDGNGQPVLDENGDQVVEVVNPFPFGDRMRLAEPEGARIGSLPASDLSGMEAAVKIWLSAIQAVTNIPASELGILSDQPTSADSLRAASYGLETKAQNRGAVFGRSHEQVARLIYAVEHPGTEVDDVQVRVVWRDFGSNSFGMQADGVSKLYQTGLYSRTEALKSMGWDSQRIEADRAARRAESLDSIGVSLPSTPPQNGPQNGSQAA